VKSRWYPAYGVMKGPLFGTMTFKMVEGQGEDHHIMMSGSLGLMLTVVPEPGG